jgi:branched-chain amino acid transport system substrate-binding protein
MITRRSAAAGLGGAIAAGLVSRRGRAAGPLRLGVINDYAGVYADIGGPGSVTAARMAVEDFGGAVGGIPVEIINADHQNKPDLGTSLARKLFDIDQCAALFDIPNSSIALAVSGIAREKNRVAAVSSANTNRLTGDSCNLNTVQWALDNYALAKSTCTAVMKTGGKSWFFITADYAFGHDMENEASAIIRAQGGTVLGAVRHPFPGNTDFSSYLLQAQASGAEVIALANATTDFQNALKQASEFGLVNGKQRIAGLTTYITDIDALGLQVAQGALLSLPFYWDINSGTRDFGKRFGARHDGKMPTVFQAAVYSSVLHYLKAARDTGTPMDGRAVVARMKEFPVDDIIFGHGQVRANGTNVHSMYLFKVKTPAESKARWDYFQVQQEVPGDQAYKPLASAGCAMAT